MAGNEIFSLSSRFAGVSNLRNIASAIASPCAKSQIQPQNLVVFD
jgi:hypothetical protein